MFISLNLRHLRSPAVPIESHSGFIDCSMSAETGSDSQQNLNLSPEEKRVFGQLFRHADYDNVSVVTGEVAVSFFEKTRLDTRVLGQVR